MLKYLLRWLQEASKAGGLRLAGGGSLRRSEGPKGERTTLACSTCAGEALGAPRSGVQWPEEALDFLGQGRGGRGRSSDVRPSRPRQRWLWIGGGLVSVME